MTELSYEVNVNELFRGISVVSNTSLIVVEDTALVTSSPGPADVYLFWCHMFVETLTRHNLALQYLFAYFVDICLFRPCSSRYCGPALCTISIISITINSVLISDGSCNGASQVAIQRFTLQ